MAARFRAILVTTASLALAGLALQQLTPSGAGVAPANDAAERSGASAQALRPPTRYHQAADGGEAPLPAGIHGDRDGRLQVALPPRPEAAEAEARLLANELAGLEQDPAAGPVPVTATILVLPIEYAGGAELEYLKHTPDLSECITVTGSFTGPLHGKIPYPGGSPDSNIDNQTVYYPSTEPADYETLIFGRRGYTEPLRAGDPNVNDGAGVDISGLTVQSYFDAQSDGRVEITGTVAPWVALPHPEAYYGIDACIPGYSPRAIPDEQLGSLAEMTVDAAEALKAMGGEYASRGFWQRLDTDGDGFVDGLWVIHAGRGQEYGGGSEGEMAIWSRSSNIANYSDYQGGYVIHDGGTPDPADDLRLGKTVFMPEDSDIGVLIEEFGHSFFGFPDLYTTDSANSVGWWAPMSSGIWGGELGGSRPVNMPLWFRSVADCGGQACGWADPVAAISYTTAGETYVIGAAGSPTGGQVDDEISPYFGQTIHEGLRIDLPTQVQDVPNPAGEGGGAYTGAGSGRTLTLDREIDLARLPAGDGPFLHLGAVWNIPRYWGYLFVEVDPDGDGEYETLPDLDGHFSDDNPFGLNDGWGLTGEGAGATTLRFDLSEWREETLPLRLRYITYRGGPGTGVWLDDVERVINELGADLRFPVDDFEDGLDGWQASGWQSVPYTLYHPHHYLVEWRNATGWDQSLLTAYQTNFKDQDEWRVDRVPANLPGAVVMYRNLKYPFSGALNPQMADPPSYGAKYGLLVVDPNFEPVEPRTRAPFGGQLQSLDAALTMPDQQQPEYVLERRHPVTGRVTGTEKVRGQLGHERFDDALGYAPGLRLDRDGDPQPWDADGSAVLPSLDGQRYSTRIVDRDEDPALDFYGLPWTGGHVMGSGNPGDANLALGAHVEVLDRAEDGSWGAVRVYNSAVDYLLSGADVAVVGKGFDFGASIDNRGSVTASIEYRFEAKLRDQTMHDSTSTIELAAGEAVVLPMHRTGIPADFKPASDEVLTLIARFDDGQDTWERRLEIPVVPAPRNEVYLPALLQKGAFE